MFVTQALSADGSCQHIVNSAAIDRINTHPSLSSTATGGYCRARQRLPLQVISGLVHKTSQLTDNNLMRLLMVKAALLTGSQPRQLSFKHCLQLSVTYVHKEFHNNLKANTCLLVYIGQRTVGNRPGRVEPRAIKRRAKPYPLLMKIRSTAQKEIRENGHQKKLK